MRRGLKRLLAAALLLTAGCASGTGVGERDERVHAALGRSLEWLARHPVDPDEASLGQVGFDTWTWYLFSVWHPDAGVRKRAGVEVDRRLRALKPPPEWNQVSLSYWAVLACIGRDRGVEIRSDPPLPAGPEIERVLGEATPTTAWWTLELLRCAGLALEPDSFGTLLATAPGDPTGYTASVNDAYRVFHEIVPSTNLGRADLSIRPFQSDFILRNLPAWLDAGRVEGDTDAVAETLVVAALLDRRDAAYDDALGWLLSRQREDGTYTVNSARGGAEDYRHVVLVGSWALLSSLDSFEPRVEVGQAD